LKMGATKGKPPAVQASAIVIQMPNPAVDRGTAGIRRKACQVNARHIPGV
jgi:hypothetical protein